MVDREGKLIVFEGVEGAGKTTQIKRSRLWLEKHLAPEVPILITREPGGTALGQELRHLLLNGEAPHQRTELLLYAADRTQHVEEILKPTLARGGVVLCDRYTDSTIAYQGYGRGLDLTLIHTLNHIATGGLESDLTLWLDVEVEIGLDRAQKRASNSPLGELDRFEQSELSFHQKVRAGFATLVDQSPPRRIRIDANGSETEVSKQIEAVLGNYFQLTVDSDSPDSQ